jgi:hypothetical protein
VPCLSFSTLLLTGYFSEFGSCIYSSLLFFLKKILSVNRRLDEWVKLEQLDLDSVETVVDEKVEDKVILLLLYRFINR